MKSQLDTCSMYSPPTRKPFHTFLSLAPPPPFRSTVFIVRSFVSIEMVISVGYNRKQVSLNFIQGESWCEIIIIPITSDNQQQYNCDQNKQVDRQTEIRRNRETETDRQTDGQTRYVGRQLGRQQVHGGIEQCQMAVSPCVFFMWRHKKETNYGNWHSSKPKLLITSFDFRFVFCLLFCLFVVVCFLVRNIVQLWDVLPGWRRQTQFSRLSKTNS